LDLKVFISSNTFYNPAFFYKQLEFTWFVFALITNVLKSRREVDTTGGQPIMLYDTLELYFFSFSTFWVTCTKYRNAKMPTAVTTIKTNVTQSAAISLPFQIAEKNIRSARTTSSGIFKAVEHGVACLTA
jgi:hypothetical protein